MVGAELHPATGSALAVRQKARGAQRRRPARSDLPLPTAVNLMELGLRLIRIFHTRADSNRSPPGRNRFKKTRSKGSDPLENWAWALSLIALTMAIHATGVIFMALAGLSIRARIESQNYLTSRHMAAIQIGLIGTVGLLLAALHGSGRRHIGGLARSTR